MLTENCILTVDQASDTRNCICAMRKISWYLLVLYQFGRIVVAKDYILLDLWEWTHQLHSKLLVHHILARADYSLHMKSAKMLAALYWCLHPLLPHLVQVKEDTLAQLKENLPPVIFCTMAGNQMDTRNLTINLPKTTRTTTRAEKRTSSRTGNKNHYIQGWEYSTLLQCLERNYHW